MNPTPLTFYAEKYETLHTARGEKKCFPIPGACHIHKAYVLLAPVSNAPGSSWWLKANLLFKLGGVVKAAIPALFAGSTPNIGLYTNLFPNTNNTTNFGAEVILVAGWDVVTSANVFVFPRKITALADEVALEVRDLYLPAGNHDFKFWVGVQSQNAVA